MASATLANSINGYVAKLAIRRTSRSTLLVEGDSDRVILSALVNRAGRDAKLTPILIDSADTIKNTGTGNRERIEAVHATAKANGVGNYACLVDREFRNFNCTAPYRDDLPQHHVHEDVLFWTRGHSVENYLFVLDSVFRYLEIAHVSVLPLNYKEMVTGAFNAIMAEALAFSLASQGSSLIGRADKVVTMQAWGDDAGNPALDINQISGSLIARSANAASITQLVALFAKHRADILASPPTFSRWLTHGHLGTQVMWTGIGFLFSGFGIAADVVEQICRGQNDIKIRICADHWATRCQENSSEESPTALIKWLSGK